MIIKSYTIKSNYHQAYINLGVLLQDLGKFDNAIDVYKIGLQNLENKLDCYINLSGVYKLKHDTEMVKKYALKALEIDDHHIFALNNLGTSLIDEGNLDYAITVLRKGVGINSNFAMLYNNLGIAYELKSDYRQFFIMSQQLKFKMIITIHILISHKFNFQIMISKWVGQL